MLIHPLASASFLAFSSSKSTCTRTNLENARKLLIEDLSATQIKIPNVVFHADIDLGIRQLPGLLLIKVHMHHQN
jgi:hypothetical protein